jgi:hypothetical protein
MLSKFIPALILGLGAAAFASPALSEDTVTKTVDTGSHTCTSQGQEVKKFDTAEAGSDRYFIEEKVSYSEKSKFLAGDCTIEGVEKRDVTFTTSEGNKVTIKVPVKYSLRAFGDCTSNLGNIGRRMGTECVFSGPTQRYK